MKKIYNFLKSMKFGIILLLLISVISVAGSLIPQEKEAMYYVRTYSSWYQVLFGLQLDHVFTSWYFIIFVALLCFNLTLCSIIRFHKIQKRDDFAVAKAATTDIILTEEEVETVKKTLRASHCKEHQFDDVTVYEKNRFGKYGTFITHLGILLTVIFFALEMYTPTVQDLSCFPKNSITLDDGTVISVEEFHIEDENKKLDYASILKITLSDGKESKWQEASVNHPVSFHQYKVYQHTYGTIGSVKITDKDGNEDLIYLEDGTFLSKDGVTGIWFNTLYPDFQQNGDDFSLVTSVSGHYENPVYTFNLVEKNDEESEDNDLKMTPMMAFPEDEIDVGELTFHFEEPIEYPGLRIKKNLPFVAGMLMASFLIMTLGFVITFLFQPVTVAVRKDGYRLIGTNTEGVRLKLKNALKK